MPTFGHDVSSYQGAGLPPLTHGRTLSFTILNVKDPGFASKAREARDRALPWGVYSWVYAGADQRVNARLCVVAVEQAGLDSHAVPLGYWADYEDAGVTEDQLGPWFAGLDTLGVRGGYYANPGKIGGFRDRPYWMAQYPWPNDGSYRPNDMADAGRPVNIWQFTSTAGTLDQNVVVDEAWFHAWVGTPTQEDGDDMDIIQVKGTGRGLTDGTLYYPSEQRFSYVDPASLPAGAKVLPLPFNEVADIAEEKAQLKAVVSKLYAEKDNPPAVAGAATAEFNVTLEGKAVPL